MRRRGLELVLLALVLLSQLALASVQRIDDAQAPTGDDLRALSTLCGAPATPADRHHPGRGLDGPLCPIGAAFDLPPILPPDAPWHPAALLLAALAGWTLLQPRAPPAARRRAYRARGPPLPN